MTSASLSRRGFLTLASAVGVVAAARPSLAVAATGPILKPIPPEWFVPFGTNAEMRWDSVDPRRYRTTQERLFVRNHTATPTVDAASYRLRIFGDGLGTPRTETDAVALSLADLKALPQASLTAVHECTGNGRRFFAAQQGRPATGTQWSLGSVGTVRWDGVRLRDVLASLGLDPRAVSIQATGLDDPYVTGGVDYGRVRRPFPVAKALDDALLAWGADGDPLLPDHGFPLRLVLPGVGGDREHQVARLARGLDLRAHLAVEHEVVPDDRWRLPRRLAAAHGQPGALGLGARLGRDPARAAARAAHRPLVERRRPDHPGRRQPRRWPLLAPGGPGPGRSPASRAWTRWSIQWARPRPGSHELLARATDAAGRTQPLVAAYNDNGYFFDAVVRHPVRVA